MFDIRATSAPLPPPPPPTHTQQLEVLCENARSKMLRYVGEWHGREGNLGGGGHGGRVPLVNQGKCRNFSQKVPNNETV